jgi:hypothetical protein
MLASVRVGGFSGVVFLATACSLFRIWAKLCATSLPSATPERHSPFDTVAIHIWRLHRLSSLIEINGRRDNLEQ